MAMVAATNTVMDRGTALHVRRRAAIEAVSAFQSLDTPAARVPHSFRWASNRDKATLWCVAAMSALPPKADIAERDHHVRFVPKADIRRNISLIKPRPHT
jgi:hypothetical protein